MRLSDFKEDKDLEDENKIVLKYLVASELDTEYFKREGDIGRIQFGFYTLLDEVGMSRGEIEKIEHDYLENNKLILLHLSLYNGEVSKKFLRDALKQGYQKP